MRTNVIYAICDEPYCLWESDIKHAATSFLKSIDHGYFSYIAQRSAPDLEDPDHGMRAATSLRLALFHGAETLFLLIGALLQAENCPHAWVAQCSTSELRTVLNRIQQGDDLLMLNRRIRMLSWSNISREILRCSAPRTDAVEEAVASFAKLWELLALNHTQQSSIDEYNSLKHGFRVAHGGFSVEIGLDASDNFPQQKENMMALGSSKWGGSFRVIKKFANDRNGSRSRQSIECAVNWDASAVAASLLLVSASIRNVVSCLRLYSGPADVQFELPHPVVFEAAFKRVTLDSMSLPTAPPVIRSTTKDQLLAEIKRTTVRRLNRALVHVSSLRE
ncbi:hypothetical protein [Variovorax sp. HJSM1_2]|uniref:hypothetical protein n=1 Tax=Variovorax sp. HJSM1_2 TaxID=3366263 RepID=UPI003BDF1DD7